MHSTGTVLSISPAVSNNGVCLKIADHGLPLDRYHHTSCCQLIQSGADTVVHVTVFGGSFCPSQSLQPVSAFISFVLGTSTWIN